eukprot:176901_1
MSANHAVVITTLCFVLVLCNKAIELLYTSESPASSNITCNGEDCVIICNGDHSCENSVINCPHNASCSLTAYGYFSASRAQFICGMNGVCDVTGCGEFSLYLMEIHGQSSSKLMVTGDGGNNALSSTIYCPINQPQPSCIIRIRSDSSPYFTIGPVMKKSSIHLGHINDVEFQCDANSDYSGLFDTDRAVANEINYNSNRKKQPTCVFHLQSVDTFAYGDFFNTNSLSCFAGRNQGILNGKRCVPWDISTEQPSSPPIPTTLSPLRDSNPTTNPSQSPTGENNYNSQTSQTTGKYAHLSASHYQTERPLVLIVLGGVLALCFTILCVMYVIYTLRNKRKEALHAQRGLHIIQVSQLGNAGNVISDNEVNDSDVHDSPSRFGELSMTTIIKRSDDLILRSIPKFSEGGVKSITSVTSSVRSITHINKKSEGSVFSPRIRRKLHVVEENANLNRNKSDVTKGKDDIQDAEVVGWIQNSLREQENEELNMDEPDVIKRDQILKTNDNIDGELIIETDNGDGTPHVEKRIMKKTEFI